MTNMTDLIITAIISYWMGSIPSAFLLMKKFKRVDITREGSGNVGAMNSFEVSGSKLMGISVFLADALKGFLAVYISGLIFGNTFMVFGTATVFAVTGHCFSAWLKFRGGRGLATALGASIMFAWPIAVIWGVFWVAGFIFRKDIHFGNISATILTAAIAIYSGEILNKYCTPPAENYYHFSILVTILMAIIFIKHLKPLKEWISKRNRGKTDETV